MSFFGSMDTSTSGLTAQRLRLDVISQNIANANTTRTPEGGPYRRKAVLFESINNNEESFRSILSQKVASRNNGVRVSAVVEDQTPFPVVYDPTHPDANAQGYVEQPNVNIVTEMVNMISASRSYEANVTAFNNMKTMINSALSIGK